MKSVTGSVARSKNESLASKRSGVPASVSTVELLPEWHEFLHALKRRGVRFLLVGGHALAAHGRPRYTQDLDVLVDPTPANARRVSAAIADFGFKETARDWRWFAKPYHITMIGRVPMRDDVWGRTGPRALRATHKQARKWTAERPCGSGIAR